MTLIREDEILYEPERYELDAGPAYHFELARRDFLKAMGGGIFIVATVRGVLAAGRIRRRTSRSAQRKFAKGHWGVASHRRRRRGYGLHGKSRNRPGHSHLALTSCRRRVTYTHGSRPHGNGRH